MTAHYSALVLFLDSKTGTPASTALLQGLQQMQGICDGLGVDGACSWVLRVCFRREKLRADTIDPHGICCKVLPAPRGGAAY